MKIFTIAIVLTAFVTPLVAQWLEHPTPGIPRTADGKPNFTAPVPRATDGKPDLTGLWNMGDNVRDLKQDDLKPWVQALLRHRAEDFGKDNPRYLCLPEGPAQSTGEVFTGYSKLRR